MTEETKTDDAEEKTVLQDLVGIQASIEGETSSDVYDTLVADIRGCSDYNDDIPMFSNAPDEIRDDYEVSMVVTRPKGDAETITSIGIWVTPTLDAVNSAAADYLTGLNRKQHVSRLTDMARRHVSSGAEGEPSFPQTIRQFVTRASSGIQSVYTPAFEACYPLIREALKARAKAYSLSKRETFEAITNAAYADFHYSQVESSGLFVKLINACIGRIDTPVSEEKAAMTHKEVKVSSDWFTGMLKTRNEAEYNTDVEVDADEEFTF